MINNKTVYKIWESLTFFTIKLYQSSTRNICCYIVLAFFVVTGFVFFIDNISVANIIASQSVTGVSEIFFNYLLFSQIHLLEFEL